MINVSIDADGSERAVRRFITQQKITWMNVFGSKAGARKLADECGVSYVPRKYLIGPDGKVLLPELGGMNLDETIAEHLKGSKSPPASGDGDGTPAPK